MKITIIIFFLYLFLPDVIKWTIYNHNVFYRKTNTSKVVHINRGVKILKNNNFDIYIFEDRNSKFGVSSSKPKDKRFYMNSNFFNRNAIGLVVENGVKKSNRIPGGGYFYTLNGYPNISKGFCPKNVKFASQTILWGINKGMKNNFLIHQNHAKVLTYRNMVGKNKKGDIIFIVSNFGGIVKIEDVINEGIKQGMVDGILFDAGSSLEYEFNDGKFCSKFISLSHLSKKILGIDEPTTYIYSN